MPEPGRELPWSGEPVTRDDDDTGAQGIRSTARTPWSTSTTCPSGAAARRSAGLLAQDAERRVFCYANAGVRKAEQADEVRFVEFWQARTGTLSEKLVFDSKLTTYTPTSTASNKLGILRFVALRRRFGRRAGGARASAGLCVATHRTQGRPPRLPHSRNP